MARNEALKVPDPPESCGAAGCNEPKLVVVAIANRGGRNVAGAGSDFLEHGVPRQGVQFVCWVTRCADCYIDERYRSRRGQRSPITGTHYVPDLETVRQYWRDNGLDEPRKAA